MKLKILFLLSLVLVLTAFATTVSALEQCSGSGSSFMWTVNDVQVSPSEVSAGGSVQVSVSVRNGAQKTPYDITMTISGKSVKKTIQPQGTEQLSLSVVAPNYNTNVQKTETVSVQLTGYGVWDKPWPYSDCYLSAEMTKTGSYKWPTSTEIAEGTAQTAADTAINSAKNSLATAETNYATAQQKIKDASNLGADVSDATAYLNTADGYLSIARSSLTSAQSSFSSKSWSSAQNSAQDSSSKSDLATAAAQNAKSGAEKVIESYNKLKTAASNSVSDLNSAIDTANKRIDDADKLINDLTILGLDTSQAKADVATARAKVGDAKDFWKEASNMLSSNNFDGAKKKADDGKTRANDAETLATKAFTVLQERKTVAGKAAETILRTSTKISNLNELYGKLDILTRATASKGVDVSSTEAVLTSAKKNIDAAEDLLSDAKSKLSSGIFTEATIVAINSEKDADSAENRLDTITSEFKTSVISALDLAVSDMQKILQTTEESVAGTQSTYGADPQTVISAQNKLQESKQILSQASDMITQAESANSFQDFLAKSESAFNLLDSSKKTAIEAVRFSKQAKMELLQKIGAGAAVLAGLGGGGFLYYRRRKKIAHSGKNSSTENHSKEELSPVIKIEEIIKTKTESHNKKTKKEEQKKNSHCISCGNPVQGKFCHHCGKKHEV